MDLVNFAASLRIHLVSIITIIHSMLIRVIATDCLLRQILCIKLLLIYAKSNNNINCLLSVR